MRRAMVGIILVMVLATPALAGRSFPGIWSINNPPTVIYSPVEQQTTGGATQPDRSLWVLNPTRNDPQPCAWDADDKISAVLGSSALLRPGETATGTFCVFADWSTHAVALRIHTLGLVGRLTLPGHITVDIEGGQTVCITSPDYWLGALGSSGTPEADPSWAYSPLVEPVAGSNGGMAARHTFTYSVTNPTSKRVRDAFAQAQIFLAGFSIDAHWCPFPWHTEWTRLYPVGADPQVWWWKG